MASITRTMIFAACLFHCASVPVGQADTVYRWTDTLGRTHFGDSPPDSQASTDIELPSAEPISPAGLRPGERATLKAIEQRRQARHRSAEAGRREQRRIRDRHERTCREHREQLRRGRRHGDGKTLSKFLRTHCW
ncbi:MAG: DUF4124 domain-containing protein [Gammaproteobacteria bacterium]|nr:DUF4124 domain-containing protein [Gammaproteobacteria bacterium]NNJ95528.1 DUF4124 domain-containing protein [Halobacteria archaeon]